MNIIWALFGNDEDGIYGTEKWRDDAPEDWLTAVQWWLRNPFHNLFWHVLNWPCDDENIWPETGTIKFRAMPPLFSFRGKIEGYIGFRGKRGVFGIALRKTRATSA